MSGNVIIETFTGGPIGIYSHTADLPLHDPWRYIVRGLKKFTEGDIPGTHAEFDALELMQGKRSQ